MPVSPEIAESNRSELERPTRLVQSLDDVGPPGHLAGFAVQAAEEIDGLLLELPDETIEATLARPDAPDVDRGEHRRHHLDRIEKTLARGRTPRQGPGSDALIQRLIFQRSSGWRRQTSKLFTFSTRGLLLTLLVENVQTSRMTASEPETITSWISTS